MSIQPLQLLIAEAVLNQKPVEWQMTYKDNITHEQVNQLFSYNPQNGFLTRNITRGYKKSGSIAWYKATDKSARVKVDRHFVYAGPLIFFIMTGEWPTKQIIHINRNLEDFRWDNLQLRPDAKVYIKKERPRPNRRLWKCEGCGLEEERIGHKELKARFCNQSCQHRGEFELKYQKWLDGDNVFPYHRLRRRAVAKRDGYKCATCGISEWNNKPITLEVEHIDGNSENNHHTNLELICPNCHSQTDTYKGKNKGNGRHYRRQRYADGKSY